MKVFLTVTLFTISTFSFAHQYHAHSDERDTQMESKIMEQVQQQMEMARQQSDEQYYLKASKLLDKIKSSPTQKKIFQAEIQQYFHQFDQALDTLSELGENASTDLLHASIYFTQGKFQQAHQHCKRLFGQVENLMALTCISQANSLQGELDKAYKVLTAAITHIPSNSSHSRSWAYVTLAEMAERKADYETAKVFYEKALEINPVDIPTRIAYADILLQENNSLKTKTITLDYLHNDLLRLRYVRAINLIENNKAAEKNSEYLKLKHRVEHYTEKNQHLHYDLLAEYYLYIKQDTGQALKWAKRHWQQQKTPRDARLLARVAQQAGDRLSKQQVINWQQFHGLEDKRLEKILHQQEISLR